MPRIRRQPEEMSRQELLQRATRKFQKMIRAEAGAYVGPVKFIDADGTRQVRQSDLGECTCVTCGWTGPWSSSSHDGNQIQTGHCVSSRRVSIVFDQRHVGPQCAGCNRWGNGRREHFDEWVRWVHGEDVLEEIERNKRSKSVVYSKSDLLGLWVVFDRRTKAAKRKMAGKVA